jgi:SAM-dependent methyltransferase
VNSVTGGIFEDPKDSYAIEKTFRRLKIPSSTDRALFRSRVASELGQRTLDDWDALRTGPEGSSDAFYDLVYRDLRTAMILGAGARSEIAKRELVWLLPRIRALGAAPIVIELGSGTGVAAAVVARLSGARVIAVDAHPGASAIANEVAAAVDVPVEAHTGTAADLRAILDGRAPDALFGFRTFRYVQPHEHVPGGFTDAARFRAASVSSLPSAEMSALLASLPAAAPIFCSDLACVDRLGEMARVGEAGGRVVAVDDVHLFDDSALGVQEQTVAYALRPSAAALGADVAVATLAGRLPEIRAGLRADGLLAEALRHEVGVKPVVWAREFRALDEGLMRMELVESNGVLIMYTANLAADRVLSVHPLSDLGDLLEECAAVITNEQAVGTAAHALDVTGESW